MKKNHIIIFGTIAGLIPVISMMISYPFWENMESRGMGELLGYAGMLVAMSMIFFALKKVRKENNGILSFKNAFIAGLLISTLASVVYAIGWMIFYNTVATDFMENYVTMAINEINNKEISDEAKAEQIASLLNQKELYKNPFIQFGFTFLELFPVGIIVTLLSAAILKRKPEV